MSTPLREISPPGSSAPRQGDVAVEFLDGSEERLLDVIRGARDLGSLSDELEQAATTWPELYHLAKSRANVLRPFVFPPRATVLEVGAGCGAVTRFLGETCDIVDALEPEPARARIAEARTRDLDNVRVFVGTIEDVPWQETYDLIVVVGVFEYVGRGSADPTPYARFLDELAGRLRPGGHIVCAIENRLGVKYLAGSPEDHTGRIFDGLEGYLGETHARTFSRRELRDLFRTAGLELEFFHAFPDYKLPRVILADSLFHSEREEVSLASRLPQFPSPDWVGSRARVVDEGSLWKSFVEAGLGGEFSNSFVILASRGAPSYLWPSDMEAAYYTTLRRATFSTETRVIRRSSGLHFKRSRLAGPERAIESGPLVHAVSDSDFIPGRDLLDVLARSEAGDLRLWLQRWREAIATTQPADTPLTPTTLDVGPHNAIVRHDGGISFIDQEWLHREYTERDVLERGVLWLAVYLAQRSPPSRLPAARVDELARVLGEWIGFDGEGQWLNEAVDREARLQALTHICDPSDGKWPAAIDQCRADLRRLVEQNLSALPLGDREHDVRSALERVASEREREITRLRSLAAEMEGKMAALQSLAAQRERENTHLEAEVADRERILAEREGIEARLRAELGAIRRSAGYRIIISYRRTVHRLFPQGTRRAALFGALSVAVRRGLSRFGRSDDGGPDGDPPRPS